MAYKFEKLPQLIDSRGKLAKKGSYSKRKTSLSNCIRAWHHSLTLKHLGGSDAASFANFHVNTNGWPGIGYHLVIEPKNIIQTAKGPRARIVYANDVSLLTYNVGNSNDFAVGVCVAGDYRYDVLDDATKASINELHAALVADKIGKADKSHHEFPGYSWKECCVFDYNKAFKFLDHTPVEKELPDVYIVQQGDTLWGIANNDDRVTVEDLIRWNNIKDPSKLQIGQKLSMKGPQSTKPEQPKNDKQPAPVTPKVLWVGVIKVDTLNARKGAGTNNPVVTQYKKGREVTVYEELKNGWLYIGNGQYVSNVGGKYVDKKKDTVNSLAGRRVESIVAKVNYYNGPRWTNASGYFTKGQGWTIVDLIQTEGSPQYKVKNSKGDIYYITARKDLVTVK
ncbi:LysM peptidoglycan-binding domain-containing protein [Bacillus sp. FJAT-49732]|uniref:LysM peptidoglycan-binding domain-containing protein n=1 Tax=Lederbergia citrisecunda TaxID=2833583 RepID=A0A942TL33_9BACI|nr:LysM peptidoglycan-binding domain-containing protein [Lederbergia citrisecunda]MBS4198627.1 LysM peptidoglycan-binding domain-containing protein [Lederbergia citrisecunda]